MSKNAVYSVITNKYDSIWSIPPKSSYDGGGFHEPEEWDFILFTNNDIKSEWNIKKINLIDDNPIKTQRKFKIYNDFIFNNYEKSIYVDGNMKMLEKPEYLWTLFGSDFTLMSHPFRSTIRAEQQALTTYKKDLPKTTKAQIEKYLSEGYVDNNLVQTGILFRNHTEKVIDLSRFWCEEVMRHSHRDQLSFNYSCWKKNFQYNTIPINSRKLYNDTNLFKLLPHINKYKAF